MRLADYVYQHSVRGSCQCGKCIDAPEPSQPTGHTADLIFFKMAAKDADKQEFAALAREEYPHWFDGKPHSYLETGGDMGDQGIALMTMGLGSLLGTWRLLTPLAFGINAGLAMELAGVGYIHIQVVE